MSEKLCLKWSDFQDNISKAFQSLRSETDLSDVTLVSEDGHQVEAHRVILAASSPFFESLLRKLKHPHPLIYMRGIKSEDLVAIVDFLYYGETNVDGGNIDAFLAIAEELNLKGLTGNSNTKEIEYPPPKQERRRRKRNQSKHEKKYKTKKISIPEKESKVEKESKIEQESKTEKESKPCKVEEKYEKTLVVPNISDIQELDDQIQSMIRKSENLYQSGLHKAHICTVCGKEGKGQNIKDHIEANHLEGVSIPCNFCEKTFRTRGALRKHNCQEKSVFVGQEEL